MSKSSKIKGKRNSKKDNFLGNKKHTKRLPYGSQRNHGYDSDDELTPIVNKSKERKKNKLNPLNYSANSWDYEENELINEFLD